ncbi:MAG: extracellular solute-binding protein [Candidatus Marinimicrobia bacterium]|nr:extracellular solute-binding protein [Candidatus Neomarinimicrobiota bacterium]
MTQSRATIIFLLLLCVVCVSCEKKRTAPTVADRDVVRLTYWCASNQSEIDLATELVNKWNSSHPKIQVKLQPIPASQSSEEALLAAIAGKTTPDICANMWPGAMDDFTSSGGLVRLDQFPDFLDYLTERMPAELLESFRAPDGHYYQIPWKTNPIMIMYNKRMFRKAGIQRLPRTYSEYLIAAKAITKDLNGDGRADQWMGYQDIRPIWWQRFFDYYTHYIAASGGKTLFDSTDICFESDASVKVFRFFQEIYRQGYFPRTTFQGDNFLAEKFATIITGPWNITHVEKFKKPGFEYDIFPVPVPDDYKGPVYTYGDHKNISIFSTTKHPAEAWQFARFLITEQADLRLLEVCSQIPLRKNLTTNPLYHRYFAANPMMTKFAEQAIYTRGVDGSSVLKEIFDAISQEYEACAIYGKRMPEEAVANAAKRAQVIIEWSRPQ